LSTPVLAGSALDEKPIVAAEEGKVSIALATETTTEIVTETAIATGIGTTIAGL
jgi:hypothetical protein